MKSDRKKVGPTSVAAATAVFYFLRFCLTNYLNIYQTNLHPICTQLTADERPEVSFLIPQGTLPWQPILWAKSTSNPHT